MSERPVNILKDILYKYCFFTTSHVPNKLTPEEETDIRNRKLGTRLEEDGHKCVIFVESYPCKIDWCRQRTCIYS
jgi:hypothetical protein